MNIKEILEKLPKSWSDITLNQFQTLSTTPITENNDEFDGIDNSLAVIAKLLNISTDDLESLPMKDINLLGNRLAFMVTPPQPAKTSIIKWKKVDEITYNDFISIIQLQEKPLENLHVFVKNFSKIELSEDEILQLPVTEVLTGFFLYRKQQRQYLKASIRSTKIQLLKTRMKEKLHHLKGKIVK